MHLRSLAVLGIFGVIAACADDQTAPRPSSATPTTEYTIQPMNCVAQIQAKSVTCTPASPGGQPLSNRLLRKDLIVGGQHQYVTLTSGNILNDNIDGVFSFTVTLTNLTPQPFGTHDGTTADTAGIKVFLTSQPTTTGGIGNVTVSNASGTGTFTNSNQPFYQYAGKIAGGILDSGQTTDTLRWSLSYDPLVTSFSFTAYVATPVPYPNGYIRGMPRELWMAPNATDFLSPTVYSAVGNVVTSDTLVYHSYYPGVITVTSDGTLTAGGADTVTDITVADTSGNRIGLDTTVLVICSRMPTVTNGSVVQDTLFSNDCNHPIDNALGYNSYRAKLYRLALTAGQTATIKVNVSSGDLDSYLVLSDTVGHALAQNDDDFTYGLAPGSAVSYTATTTGVYIIQVSSFFPSGTGPYDSYTMTVSVSP